MRISRQPLRARTCVLRRMARPTGFRLPTIPQSGVTTCRYLRRSIYTKRPVEWEQGKAYGGGTQRVDTSPKPQRLLYAIDPADGQHGNGSCRKPARLFMGGTRQRPPVSCSTETTADHLRPPMRPAASRCGRSGERELACVADGVRVRRPAVHRHCVRRRHSRFWHHRVRLRPRPAWSSFDCDVGT